MIIGFDAKRLFNNFTGLGNYSRFVVNALLDHAPGNELVLYSPKAKQHPEVNPIVSREHVSVIQSPAIYQVMGLSSLWRSWAVSHHASVKRLDVFHGLSQELPIGLPSSTLKVVTVHDLIFIRFPELYKSIDAAIYKAKVRRACEAADIVVAISQQTADDLTRLLNVPSAKIKVVYQGCHPQFRRPLSRDLKHEVRQRHGLPEKYLLSVGTLEKRKNMLLAVRALAQIRNQVKIPLVMVGRATEYKDEIVKEAERLGLGDRLIFLHQVPFADLPAVYQGASVFLYPSIFEGFGIPIVEALESGVPVISSTGSCFEEAGGPDTIYVDPQRPEELAMQVLTILSDESQRLAMIARGHAYVTRFNPGWIAHDLMAVYKRS